MFNFTFELNLAKYILLPGIHGEHTESEGGIYDVSNKRRLGLTEIEAVKEMVAGVQEIIKMEKDLSCGKSLKSPSCTLF